MDFDSLDEDDIDNEDISEETLELMSNHDIYQETAER